MMEEDHPIGVCVKVKCGVCNLHHYVTQLLWSEYSVGKIIDLRGIGLRFVEEVLQKQCKFNHQLVNFNQYNA